MNKNIQESVATEVKSIVNAYVSKVAQKKIAGDAYHMLVTFLYFAKYGNNCDKTVKSVLKDKAIDLNSYFTINEIVLLLNNYESVVDECLNGFNKSILRRDSYLSSQPKELTEFLHGIMRTEAGSNVYLPFAGMCSEAMALEDCKVYGEEISITTWAYAQILLQAHGSKANIVCGNSFESISKHGILYDTIMFNPPLGIRYGQRNRLTEVDALKQAFDNKLKVGGRMCCILAESFLYTTANKEIRQYLIDNGYLRSIILMPTIFMPYTAIHTVVVVLEKKTSKHFMLVNGRDFVVSANRTPILKYNSLLESIDNLDKQYCTVMSKDQLLDNYSLSPSRYLLSLPKIENGENLYKLRDLVSLASNRLMGKIGSNIASDFAIRKLSDTYINCDVEQLPIEHNEGKYKYEVTGSCIVAQPIFGRMKIGSISINKKSVIETPIEAFFLNANETIVKEKYLLKMLVSKYVQKQVEAYSIGLTIKRLSDETFWNLLIPIPTLEQQTKILMEDLHQGISEREQRLEYELSEYKKDVHIKKHAIGQFLFGLNSNMSLLKTIREVTNGNFDESKIIGEGQDAMSVGDIFDNISSLIKSVSKAVNAFTAGEDTIYKEEYIALAPFFEHYCETHKNSLYRIEYQSSGDDYANQSVPLYDEDDMSNLITLNEYAIEKGEPLKYVKFAVDALNLILLDVCTNAVEYGFKGRETYDNIVRISIESKETSYIVYISNNGAPANTTLTPSDVFKFGITTSGQRDNHSGIGGYEIDKLMKRYGGSVEFISQPESDFPVTYKLIFNKTNIVASYKFS